MHLMAASLIDIYFDSYKAWIAVFITASKNYLPSGFHFGIESQIATQAPS